MIDFPYRVRMDDVIQNSFKDYHVRGFDYLCLKRSPWETLKVYFFDGDVSSMPEVVTPHDHRYDFSTTVLAGRSENVWYQDAEIKSSRRYGGEVFERFEYRSKLVDPDSFGFVHAGTVKLRETNRTSFGPGQTYDMFHDEIHTIRMVENETILALVQYEDRVTDQPTQAFFRGKETPSLSGLYEKFTPDQVLELKKKLSERVPSLRLPVIEC